MFNHARIRQLENQLEQQRSELAVLSIRHEILREEMFEVQKQCGKHRHLLSLLAAHFGVEFSLVSEHWEVVEKEDQYGR